MTVMESVYSAVRTDSLYNTYDSSLKGQCSHIHTQLIDDKRLVKVYWVKSITVKRAVDNHKRVFGVLPV